MWITWESFANFFVWQEGHIWAVSAVFGLLFLAALRLKTRYPQIRCLPLLIACLVWIAYGFWEHWAHIKRANIRVDLLFGWPILFSGTAIAILLSVQSVLRAIRISRAITSDAKSDMQK
jgi:hypothetical protein